jgi:dynein heavy chain
MISIQLT